MFWDNKEISCLPDRLYKKLKEISPSVFLNIHTVLKILATLPITMCEAERSNSVIQPCKALKGAENVTLRKRKMLSIISGVFDPLGLASPVVIVGKILYSQVCLEKFSCDEGIQNEIAESWKRWIKSLERNKSISVPRNVVRKDVVNMKFYGFADASELAISTAIYVITWYSTQEFEQHLLVAKSRIAPKMTVPRLELVAAHTLSRLMTHVKDALSSYQINEVHGWVDSTTVLHWIEGKGTWNWFVRNRTKRIKEGGIKEWHYVSTKKKPSDLGTHRATPNKLGAFWFHGPNWPQCKDQWPCHPEITETMETEKLPKNTKQMLVVDETV